MKKILIISLLTCFQISAISSHNATIIFKTDTNAKVRIYKPIDGQHNPFYLTDKIDLTAELQYVYNLNVHDFCTIKFEFSNSSLNYVKALLFEGDTLMITNRKNLISYEGANAKGNYYLAANEVGDFDDKIAKYTCRRVTDKFDYEGLMKDIRDSITEVYSSDIIKMKEKGEINFAFANVMNKSLNNATAFAYFVQMRSLLEGQINKYKPSKMDSVIILSKLDSIFYYEGSKDNNSMKYYYSLPYDSYCFLKYRLLNKQERNSLLGGYDEDTFGAYRYSLLAPENVKYSLIAIDFLFNLQNQYTYYNANKMLAFLTEKMPQSEYLPIFHKLLEKQKLKNLEPLNHSIKIIDGSKINSLRDLMKAEGLKGKYGYIDLWATYCSPCKVQFQYNDELHKVLNQYENIEKIYISIDDEKDDDLWKEQISYFQLKGYHLRVSASLKENIQNLVFGKELMSVPRYILVDNEGNILNNNLPLPKNTFILKKEIDKILIGRSE